MAVGATSRLGLTTWSAMTDPLTRQQLLHDHQQIDTLAAIDMQVATANDLPPAGVRGRYAMALDTSVLYRDTGSAWVQPAVTPTQAQTMVDTSLSTIPHTSGTDADTLTAQTALHYLTASSGNANLPSGIGSLVVVEVKRLTASAVVQIAYSLLTPRVRWHRFWDGTTWSTWKRIGLSDLAAPTQSLDMAGYNITGVADPLNDQDVATKRWVLTNMGAWTAPVPVTLNTLIVRNSTRSGASVLSVATMEGGKLVRLFGTFVAPTATAADSYIAELPAGYFSTQSTIIFGPGGGNAYSTNLIGGEIQLMWIADLDGAPSARKETVGGAIRPDGKFVFVSTNNINLPVPAIQAGTHYVDATFRV